jgi:hypothetical protein
MGMDFTPGMNFAKDINKLFHSTVHANARAKPFTMVVSFGRASFWLDEESVAIALTTTKSKWKQALPCLVEEVSIHQ